MSVLDVGRGLPGLERVAQPPRPAVPAGPYLVIGASHAGRSAATALADRSGSSSVVVCDDLIGVEVRAARRALSKRGIGFEDDPVGALDRVGAIVKSPGIPMDHAVIEAAGRRGIPVIDEFELGWRLSWQPVVAVTGTDGKSTTTALVNSALRAAGGNPLLTGNIDGFRGCPSMSVLPREHQGWVVAEVSSYQAEGCPEFLPSAAVLTNLTEAHLGRHGSMAEYAAAKRRLFVRGENAVSLAVLNADDAFGRRLAAEVTDRGGRALTFGVAQDADFRIRACRSTLRGATVQIDMLGEAIELETRLPGAHNAANVAAALALAGGLGLQTEVTVAAIESTDPVPGRFEPVDEGQPFDIVVDFAHTPAAVARTLETGRELVAPRRGRLIALMGKVGAAIPQSREAIGRAARAGADHLVICSSALRGEPPLLEVAGIAAGARKGKGGEVEVILDRRKAIARALSLARAGDLVAILGRGARRRMTYDTKGRAGSFDDRQVVRELLSEML
jgi:UDP-N-acetylmuramoyl-L-alanyl-D-glutamate--2,6-diaminopimelate ligase